MARTSYGPIVKARVRSLLEALLNSAHETPYGVSCRWKDTSPNKLLVSTKLRTLQALLNNDTRYKKFTKNNVREAFRCIEDFLEILEDHRVQRRGSENWHFTLTLWSRDTNENLKHFDKEWEQRRPEKSKRQEKMMKSTEDTTRSLTFQKSIVTANMTFKQDWEDAPALDEDIFFGRTKELATLEKIIIKERCRLVTIVGMGGIGKTNLSLKFYKRGIGEGNPSSKINYKLQDRFEYTIWKSLKSAPPIEDTLTYLIKFLSDQQEFVLPNSLEDKISLLLQYLQVKPCLLVLDNVDRILKSEDLSGEYLSGYESYGELFRHVGEKQHQSCLLLTSREIPKDISMLEGERRPVRILPLNGLEKESAKQIFTTIGSFLGSDKEWTQIIDFYYGNPLALEIIARYVYRQLGGRLSSFLEEGTPVFGDIRRLLDWHFYRFSKREKEVLYWLAINQEPISILELKEDVLSQVSKKELPETLQILKRRLPIEIAHDGRLTLQPVLLEYITDKLVDETCDEIKNEKNILLKTHALLKAQSADYIIEIQKRLILEPIIEKFKDFDLYVEDQITKIFRNLPKSRLNLKRPKPSYTAGNILNLFRYLNVDLNGYDFSNLTVWQAYLQGTKLQNVNFANSDISKSVFTQTFGDILSVVFSPDGRFLATGDTSGYIRLWQISDGQQFFAYQGHKDWIWSMDFSFDGQLLVTCSSDQTVKIWQVSTGKVLKILEGHTNTILSVAFSPDGQLIASSSGDQTIKLWQVSTGQLIKTLQGHTDEVCSVAFSPDGQLVASGSGDQTIKLWQVSTGQLIKTLQGHTDSIRSIAFSPNDRVLATASSDLTVKLWQVSTGQLLKTLQGHTDEIWSVAFSPDGHHIVSGSGDQTVRLWQANTGQLIKTLEGHTNPVRSVAFSPDGHQIASGSYAQMIKFWEISKNERLKAQCFKTLNGYTYGLWSVAFSPNGQLIVAGGYSQTISAWQAFTDNHIESSKKHAKWIWSLGFSPDGKTLASGGEDQSINLWQVEYAPRPKLQFLKSIGEHTDGIWSIAFSPDGQILASGGGRNVLKLWELKTGQCIKTLPGHESGIRSLSFSPNGKLLVSCSDDKTLKIWEVSSGKCTNTLEGHTGRIWATSFSSSGQVFASGSVDQTIKVWKVETGECLSTLEGHTNSIWSVAFSPDAQLMASGSGDETIKIWNVNTGKCVNTLEGHTHWVRSVAFSPCGKILASGSEDGMVRTWNINTGECIKTLRASRPYEGMNITDVTGFAEAQKVTLKELGAVEFT